MASTQLLKQVNNIFSEVFDNEQLIINETTNAFDIEEWNSLAQIQLATTIEKYFNIRFTAAEVQSWNNVGEIMNSISKKQSP